MVLTSLQLVAGSVGGQILKVIAAPLTLWRALLLTEGGSEATTFVQAINQYLCLCLSRNAVSPVLQVFEVSVEIFWRVLAGMRTKLKVGTTCVVIIFHLNLFPERDRSASA